MAQGHVERRDHVPNIDKLSIYISKKKIDQAPVERLIKLGKKLDRSVNYLVVEAILEYVDKHEKK